MTKLLNFSTLRRSLALGVIALSAAAPAQAIVYDFRMTGGAQSSLAWTSSHLFVDVTENSTTPDNDVLFRFTNGLTEPQASISYLYFDMGANSSLFSGLSLTETSGTVSLLSQTPVSHVFLPSNFTPEYKFGLADSGKSQFGINPGEYAVLSATLGGGSTFADVIGALNAGLTASTGLRVGVFTYHLLGSLPMDDAAHVTNSIVAVPEAETWAMMLAGLGLTGFMARRRKA